MNEIQKQVAKFVSEHRLETDVPTRLLDVISELGELSKESLKATNYGSKQFSPTANWKCELGDVFFSLICVANSTGINVEKALETALEKYKGRFKSHGNAGSRKSKQSRVCDRELVMFDIDGTLTRTLQVDGERYGAALMQIVDAKDFTMDSSFYPHVTDSAILHYHFMASHGQPPQSSHIGAFQECFMSFLTEAFAKNPKYFQPVPGARQLLKKLKRSSEYAVSIATGGWRCSASFKLRAAGLHVEDLPAAFADDGHSREEIMQTAYRRACEHYGCDTFARVIYIGDGTHDVRASKNLGYDFIGIAETERQQRLRSFGAEHIAPDYSDVDGFLNLLAKARGAFT